MIEREEGGSNFLVPIKSFSLVKFISSYKVLNFLVRLVKESSVQDE